MSQPIDMALLSEVVSQAVAAALMRTPSTQLVPGTFQGTDDDGDGIVILDSDVAQLEDQENPVEAAEALHAPIIGPHPVYGARVVVAFAYPATYILGEVIIAKAVGGSPPRVLLDTPKGEIVFYDENGEIVGKLSAADWTAGVDLGARAQTDQFGGLRIFNEFDHLTALLNASGLQIREPLSGIVRGALSQDGLYLASETGNTMTLLPEISGKVAPPKWAGTFTTLPSDTSTTPPLRGFTTQDLELRFVACWSNAVLGAESSTPPSTYTEVTDFYDSTEGCSLLTSLASKAPATSNATRTFTTTDTFWQFDNGHTVVLKGDISATGTPTIRSGTEITQLSIHRTASFDLTIPAATGVATGDVIVAFVAVGNDGGSVPASWSTPDGFVPLGLGFQAAPSPVSMLGSGCWYKIATASEPAEYTFTINMVGLATSVKKVHVTAVAVKDVDVLQGGADILFEPPSRCRVYPTADTALNPVNTPRIVNFGAASYDPGNNFDFTNDRYVVPQSGPYIVGWSVITTATASAGERHLTFLRKNGTDNISGGSDITSAATGRVRLTGQDNLDLEEGDYLEVIVQQVNGTTDSIDGSLSEAANFFYVQRGLST